MKLLEYYKWEATLDDGHIISQSANGEKEPFKFDSSNPDLDKIRIFKLIPKESNTKLNEIIIEIPQGAKLIYFRRTIANTGDIFPKWQLTLAGWHLNTSLDNKGKNIKYILHIFPNGKIYSTTGQWPPVEEFIASLPQKNISEVKGCSNCEQKLERTESNEK